MALRFAEMKLTMIGALSLVMISGAHAEQASDQRSLQVAGLFMQTCVRFSGNPAGLRSLLSEKKVPVLPKEVSGRFLGSRPGIAFDASNKFDRLAVVSHDDGSCTAFSEGADGDQAVAAVEKFLEASKIQFRLIDDYPDKRASDLRHRTYEASSGERKWGLMLSTAPTPGRIHVMFTALPKS